MDLNLSYIEVVGDITIANEVSCIVDPKREEIAKHHSATHLLHFALSKILGEGIEQAGSLVEHDRLRFDFTYPKALTKEQLDSIEETINNNIAKGAQTVIKQMSINEAKEMGAKALFGEKYGDIVRVVKLGESIELCAERM